MAELIPPLNSCLSRMQSGEKRFARRLGSHLEDDYLCWYETGVGMRPRYADFIIMHPLRGLLLLEVKDWRLDIIRSANPNSFELATSSGLKTVANPLQQARQCTYKLIQQLEHDPQLVHQSGSYKGKLIMPYGFGVVFTNIARGQFEAAGLGEVIPVVQTICKDEMTESMDIETFQQRLWDMFNYRFDQILTQPQIDRIRWHLFPEIRVQPQPQLELLSGNEADVPDIPDIIKVMDLEQEKLARGLGAGHRVIHGVAGSGKTMILGYRCLHLAKSLRKPILVLCYNVTLAVRLRSLLEKHGLNDRVNVYSIHRWANTVLKSFNFKPPQVAGDNFDAAIDLLIKEVGKGNIPRGQYGAVLVDEGHDFKPAWLRLVVDMVDPDTNSLLLLYDDTQSIYKQSSGLGFSLKQVGIEAQGRTTILKLNYRNTEQILKFAYDFIGAYVAPSEGSDDKAPVVVPDTTGRKGAPPAVMHFAGFADEARYTASIFRKLNEQRAVPWSGMCVLYSHSWMGKALADAMAEVNVPYTWLKDSVSKQEFDIAQDTVKLITMHSSKGLEFPTVAVCGVGALGVAESRIEFDAKLLYVAMTRATENLLITCSGASPFAVKLQEMAVKHRAGAVA